MSHIFSVLLYRSSRTPSRLHGIWVAVALGIGLLCGCAPIQKKETPSLSDITGAVDDTPPQQAPREGTGRKVRFDGGAIVLGESDRAAWTTTAFLDAIEQHLAAGDIGEVTRMTRTWPDVAHDVLLETGTDRRQAHAIRAIASSFDAMWPERSEWEQAALAVTADNDSARKWLERKRQAWDYLQHNEPDNVSQLKLSQLARQSLHALALAESLRIESIAAMMRDDHDASITLLQQAIDEAGAASPYTTARLVLLLGEYERHAGNYEQWQLHWSDAVGRTARMLVEQGISDPVFLIEASQLRPLDYPWPESAVARFETYLEENELALRSSPASASHASRADLTIWLVAGLQHLSRGEGENALVAFKKAEAFLMNELPVDELHLLQARSLVAAGQPGAASAILIRIASNTEVQPACNRARAILGSMKLENGSADQGLALIESALENADRWPVSERLGAQADHGLALLMTGQEEAGVEVLDKTAGEFVATGEHDEARQCFTNLAAYFEATGQREPMRQTQARLAELDRTIH